MMLLLLMFSLTLPFVLGVWQTLLQLYEMSEIRNILVRDRVSECHNAWAIEWEIIQQRGESPQMLLEDLIRLWWQAVGQLFRMWVYCLECEFKDTLNKGHILCQCSQRKKGLMHSNLKDLQYTVPHRALFEEQHALVKSSFESYFT